MLENFYSLVKDQQFLCMFDGFSLSKLLDSLNFIQPINSCFEGIGPPNSENNRNLSIFSKKYKITPLVGPPNYQTNL